jgi:uncharacterized damage-inducible protein DinB
MREPWRLHAEQGTDNCGDNQEQLLPNYVYTEITSCALETRNRDGFSRKALGACRRPNYPEVQRRVAVREITAEQAHLFVHNVILGILKTESRTTRSVLAAVPGANLDYRPDPCAKTARELMRHIASADNFFLKSVVDGVFAPGSVKIPQDVNTPEEIVEWYDREYAKNFDAVTELSGEELIRMVNFRGLFERPAYTFLHAGLVHAIHHRGQLSTYLRPMGGKVPAIYGESYDSAEAKKAAPAQA